MNSFISKIKKNFFIYGILLIFLLVISILFSYLYKIEVNIGKYDNYKNDINKLIIQDIVFDEFIENKDEFVNFDLIVKQTNDFEKVIKHLIHSDMKDEFGIEIYNKVVNSYELYKKKLKLIEMFKSKHTANLNSIHYIYEINQSFTNDKDLADDIKVVINNTLFLSMQHFANLNENKDRILENLEFLMFENERIDFEKLDLLHAHSTNILRNIKTIKNLRTEAKGLKLGEKLYDTQQLLISEYKKKTSYQFIIAVIFFISILIIVFIIYKEYKKVQNIKSELSAFKYAVENSDNTIVLTDSEKNILYVNDIFEKNTGFEKKEVVGKKPKLLSSGLTSNEVYADLNKKLEAGEKWEGEFINKRKDGSIFYEKASIVPIIIENEPIKYLAIKLDVTKYIRQKEELELSDIAFNNIQEGILICDKDKQIITTNKAFETISGYMKEELIGMKPNLFRSGYHDRIFYKQMWLSLKEKGSWKGKVYDKKKDGEIIPIWLNISSIKDKNGEIVKYIAVHTSLKEIIETQEKADFLAYHDSLTKLPNRVKLEEDLEYSISIASRNELNLFVLFIDLDRFKIINDTLGHGVGDILLKVVSKRIKNILRGSDLVARMGGDEFIVVLDSSRNKNSAGYVCQKLLDVIQEPIVIENDTLNTSASIGVSMYPDDGMDITTLIKNADTAMYHAKKLGKNNYQYYDKQLSINVHEQLKIEQALKDVIANDELYLMYQPQYALESGKVIAFEALVRWDHNILGTISPEKFIPIAEDTGTIIEIGKHIFDMACRDFVKFKNINEKLSYIAINISSIQFRDKNFVKDIVSIIEKYDLKSSEVELEVTERYIMEFSQKNMNTINTLKELGFRFSIDDFGTGYSSMSYLTKLPIDVIKVDKAFVDGTPDDNNNVQISKAIIALSKSLGYRVIAEGIETIEQEEYLKSLNCEMGQGYFFSKPLLFNDVVKFLEKKDI
ncbi:EAL domain-containing protein [Arcobacter sp. LA11]|uniref:EAL domain-containing protein n=1 Tax=Arcobacter sp. LA11 TaxID=1898176 RepID=UPI001160BC80|nr:EAL domain-containing protein [Arcobacter sp. LA11]